MGGVSGRYSMNCRVSCDLKCTQLPMQFRWKDIAVAFKNCLPSLYYYMLDEISFGNIEKENISKFAQKMVEMFSQTKCVDLWDPSLLNEEKR